MPDGSVELKDVTTLTAVFGGAVVSGMVNALLYVYGSFTWLCAVAITMACMTIAYLVRPPARPGP